MAKSPNKGGPAKDDKPKSRKPRKEAPAQAASNAPAPEAPAEPNLGGRPTIYTEELGLAVCTHIANGLSLRSIEKIEGMPTKTTVLNWALQDRDGFLTIYAHARELQLESEADEINDIADDGVNDWMEREQANGEKKVVYVRDSVDRSKLRVETRKWRLTKLQPQKYGDKLEATHKGDAAFMAIWQQMGGGASKKTD
jgi:hypothetical protein